MSHSQNIAKHLQETFFGGNWTVTNFKSTLEDITWEEANHNIQDLNTIVTLSYHAFYYVDVIAKVFEGHPLHAKDEWSFNHPNINTQNDWEDLIRTGLSNVQRLVKLVINYPDDQWDLPFTNEIYGSYYRNLHGLIEHSHYHLGQISLIKKMIRQAR